MGQYKKKNVFSDGLRGGFFPIAADDATFVSNKGSAAEEGDRYWNDTTKRIREYDGSSWRWLEAGLLEGDTKAQIIAAAVSAVPGAKVAYGDIQGNGTVRLDTGVISGTTGTYNGDTGFTAVKGIILSHNNDNPAGQHGWDYNLFYTYQNILSDRFDVSISATLMTSVVLLWFAVGN